MSKRILHASPGSKLKGATSTSNMHKKKANAEKAAENYLLQASRIQVTDDWKDACINQELEQIAKLEQFIQEERARAHRVASSLLDKQKEVEARRAAAL